MLSYINTIISDVPDPQPYLLDVVSHIQDYRSKDIKYNRKADRQKGGVNKKKTDLADGDVQTLCQVRANTKALFFEVSNDFLEHLIVLTV